MPLFHDMLLNSAPLTTLTQTANATSTSGSITFPTILANDVCVLFEFAVNSSGSPTIVTPSGFTLIHDSLDSFYRYLAHYKVLDGTESGTSLAGTNGTSLNRKVMNIFRPNAKISTVTLSGLSNSAPSSGDPAPQTILMSGKTTPLIGFAWWARTSFAMNARTYSPVSMTEINTSDSYLVSAYINYNVGSTPVDITIDTGDPGIYIMTQNSWYLQFS